MLYPVKISFNFQGLPDIEGNFSETRFLLRREWASLRKVFKLQPLDYIKYYFHGSIRD